MGETTIREDLELVVSGASEEQLGEYVKDPGMLGELARAELGERGVAFHYSNTNGVQEGGLILDAAETRSDSLSPVDAPGQTLDQQVEGKDEIDPHTAAGVQEAPVEGDDGTMPGTEAAQEQVEENVENAPDGQAMTGGGDVTLPTEPDSDLPRDQRLDSAAEGE